MAYAITANSIVQVTFRGKVVGQDDITVLNYKLRTPISVDDGKLALDNLLVNILGVGGLFAKYMLCKSIDYSSDYVQAQWVLSTRHAYVRRIPDTLEGQVPVEVLAPNTAFVIERQTEQAGPSGHGITHMGGVPQSFMTSGGLTGAGSVAYTALGAQMILPITTVSGPVCDPVIVRKAAIATSPVLTGFSVSNVARTMHRRTVGLGS